MNEAIKAVAEFLLAVSVVGSCGIAGTCLGIVLFNLIWNGKALP
jgi:hypothetical protein